MDQIADDMMQNEKLSEQAKANSKEQFKQVFEAQALQMFIQRHSRNEVMVKDFMANVELRDLVVAGLLELVYQHANMGSTI